MNYQKQEIKKGVTVHQIYTEKFKTNLYAIFLAVPITRKNVTLNALIGAILRRGSMRFQSQEIINKELEEMYGANFDCGIEKSGNNHILKFYLESINDEYTPTSEELNKKCLNILFDIVFNPLIVDGMFKNEYFESEKKNLKQLIEGKINNKGIYAFDRCIEEMFKDDPFGLYRLGYIEDLEKITSKELYEYYKELINTCKIDIFCSGKTNMNCTKEIILNDKNMINVIERMPNYITDSKKVGSTDNKVNIVEESMEVIQGKLVMGVNLDETNQKSKYAISVYNAILGGGANSKLFQNVREKHSLAYTVGSNYIKTKSCIFIRAGIEIENYEEAVETIKEQLEDIKKEKFSDKDIESAKQLIISSVDNITEEQDTEITYCYGQELLKEKANIEEYKENILNVTKEEIVDAAKTAKINTIYFLKN